MLEGEEPDGGKEGRAGQHQSGCGAVPGSKQPWHNSSVPSNSPQKALLATSGQPLATLPAPFVAAPHRWLTWAPSMARCSMERPSAWRGASGGATTACPQTTSCRWAALPCGVPACLPALPPLSAAQICQPSLSRLPALPAFASKISRTCSILSFAAGEFHQDQGVHLPSRPAGPDAVALRIAARSAAMPAA